MKVLKNEVLATRKQNHKEAKSRLIEVVSNDKSHFSILKPSNLQSPESIKNYNINYKQGLKEK